MRADIGGNGAGVAADPRRETIAWAGWHPDPFDLAGERWWDGTRWTGNVRGALRTDGAGEAAEREALAAERVWGQPPGWYQWRGQVARWWDGSEWGAARRPFADHVRPAAPGKLKSRPAARWGLASVLLLVVVGVVASIILAGGSIPVSYQTRVGSLCRQTFARERADIQKQSAAAVKARRSGSQAALVARLLRTLVHDSFLFDAKLEALDPPPSLLAARQRYATLERQDNALYALVIPRLEGRSGVRALTTVSALLAQNAQELQRLLTQLGGSPCSTSPLGLE